ncbi:MAG: polymer-forming cytoskeletal protein [Rhodospirillales bacterium]|jgi:cytoskeletal protein CcmA (bactofilin family)|nr:polymer-forming cytoskeletal protein [Rhodospirillales bacterium]
MFQKKDGDGAVKRGDEEGKAQDVSAPPLKPFSRKGSHHAPAKPTGSPTLRHDIPRRGVESARRFDRVIPGESESRKLTVGREICLSGEITSCERLIVEGRVEASLSDAHAIEIAPTGVFMGSAEVNEADISGLYEGELIARDILTVRSGGRINGTVRYGRISIEAGGEISGDMRALSQAEAEADDAGDDAGAGAKGETPAPDAPKTSDG